MSSLLQFTLNLKIAPTLPINEGKYPNLDSSIQNQLWPSYSDSSFFPWLAILFTILFTLAYTYKGQLIKCIPSRKTYVPVFTAFDAIHEIHKSNLLEQKSYREYTIKLVDVFRGHFSLLNKTYEESLGLIDCSSLSKEAKLKAKSLLSRVERVKFAREVPTFAECQSTLNDVQDVLKSDDDQKKTPTASIH